MFGTLRISGDDEPVVYVEQQPRRPRPPATSQHTACTSCRAKKVKCTGEPDGCQRCKAARRPCHYTNPNQGKLKPGDDESAGKDASSSHVEQPLRSHSTTHLPRRSSSSPTGSTVAQGSSALESSPNIMTESWLANAADNMLWEFDPPSQAPEFDLGPIDDDVAAFGALEHLSLSTHPAYAAPSAAVASHATGQQQFEAGQHFGHGMAHLGGGVDPNHGVQQHSHIRQIPAANHFDVSGESLPIPLNSQAARFLSTYVPCTAMAGHSPCLAHALRLLSKSAPNTRFWNVDRLLAHNIAQSTSLLQMLSMCEHCMSQPPFLLVLISLAKRMYEAFAMVSHTIRTEGASRFMPMALSFASTSSAEANIVGSGDLHEPRQPIDSAGEDSTSSQALASSATMPVSDEREAASLLFVSLKFKLHKFQSWLALIRQRCSERDWDTYRAECDKLDEQLGLVAQVLHMSTHQEA